MDDGQPHENPALSRLYALAEAIVAEITLAAPDWCQIARDAATLANETRQKCRCLSNDLTRK